mmetsp:Transcript_28942/g.49335  ORF Transcript_28942/g.49335 Transcript_28942/m.49335 type:complete len:123 (-) Transcript_28942:1136-1504(-)
MSRRRDFREVAINRKTWRCGKMTVAGILISAMEISSPGAMAQTVPPIPAPDSDIMTPTTTTSRCYNSVSTETTAEIVRGHGIIFAIRSDDEDDDGLVVRERNDTQSRAWFNLLCSCNFLDLY